MLTIEKQIRQNNLKTYFFTAILSLVVIVLGLLLSYFFNWGLTGTSVFILVSIGINILSYFYSDKIVLRSTKAKLLTREQVPELFAIVERLTSENNIPIPKLYILDERTMNAFATGRNARTASIAVTKGLLEKCTLAEVEGVVAHELSHIKNNDVRLMTIIAVAAGIITLIADMFWYSQIAGVAQEKDRSGILVFIGIGLAIFAPLSAFFIQLAISRKREYVADAMAAQMTHNGSALASALKKISLDIRLPEHRSVASAHLFFSSPQQADSWFEKLFLTHPPIQDRILRLEVIK